MTITVHRSPDGVLSVELRAATAAEEDELYRLAEAARRSDRLALDAGGFALEAGPFWGWHVGQLRVIDPKEDRP